MNTSSESQPVEKVIIAAGPVEEIPTSHKEFNSDSHAAQWRMTSVRLTGLGGFLLIMSLMLVLYMPWILKSAILTRFWSTPFGKSGYFLVVDITSLILWDEDHGFFGTRLLGLAAVSLLYFVLNNIFEYLGVPLIQEKAGRR